MLIPTKGGILGMPLQMMATMRSARQLSVALLITCGGSWLAAPTRSKQIFTVGLLYMLRQRDHPAESIRC